MPAMPPVTDSPASTHELPATVMPAAESSTAAAPAASPPPSSSSTPIHVDSPAVADDNDVIEQEWVDKAKAIIERTSEDPYTQNKEINKFKADYLQKRYKREIKVNEA